MIKYNSKALHNLSSDYKKQVGNDVLILADKCKQFYELISNRIDIDNITATELLSEINLISARLRGKNEI